MYVNFMSEFTPEGGGDPRFESEEHVYGNLVDPEAIRCDLHIEETVPGGGTFVGDGHVKLRQAPTPRQHRERGRPPFVG